MKYSVKRLFLFCAIFINVIILFFPSKQSFAQANIYEAEDAALVGSVIETVHSGYSGTGFVNFVDVSGAKIIWSNIYTNSSGYYELVFRYALGKADRQVDILVNGVTVKSNINFASTGTWTNWTDLSLFINLNSGNNVVEIVTTGNDGPNTDYMKVLTTTNVTPPQGDLGDANGDGKVDGIDYVIWLNHFGIVSPNGAQEGDFNLDGNVDGIDYVIWLSNFGASTDTPTPSAIPTNPPSNTPIPTQPKCTDSDRDGYSIEGGTCGQVDCNDSNPNINPGISEICGNDTDENCDGISQQCKSGLPVVPGGFGFGMDTRAAYGKQGVNPTVYKVTNLAASGNGSLKNCLDGSSPRVCIFEVSGTISTTSNLNINNPYITIAGQTAPSPGITIRGAALSIRTHDVLVQHVRIRVGDGPGPGADNRDGIGIANSGAPPYNVVIDHCSVSWAIDENVQYWYALSDSTISNSISSEALLNSLHSKGGHSMGLLVGEHAKRISVIGNLLAHNNGRNPLIKGNTETEVINNVIYNWFWFGTRVKDMINTGGELPSKTDIVGNYYKPGTDTGSNEGITVQASTGSKVFVKGNIGPGRTTDSGDDWLAVNGSETYRSNTSVTESQGRIIYDVNNVMNIVLNNSGARPTDRDSVDTRIVNEVRNGTGRIIDSQNEVGGWPDLAQNYRILTIPSNPHGDNDDDGYTNLEEWLHAFSADVE